MWSCFKTLVASVGLNDIPFFIPGSTFYQPECLLSDMDNIHTANGNMEPGDKHVSMAAVEGNSSNLNSDPRRLSPPCAAIETSKETTATEESTNNVSQSTQPSPSPAPDRAEDQNNNNQRGSSPAQSAAGQCSPSPSPPAPPSMPKVDIGISPDISISTVSLPFPLFFYVCKMLLQA